MVSRAEIQQAVANFCRQIPPALGTAASTAVKWGGKAVTVIKDGALAAGRMAARTAVRVKDVALPLINRTARVCREHPLPAVIIATGGACIVACARRAISACCGQKPGDDGDDIEESTPRREPQARTPRR